MNKFKIARLILETSINAVDGSTDDYCFGELKEIMQEIIDQYESDQCDDFNLDSLAGGEVRVINKSSIDEIWHDGLIDQIKDCYEFPKVLDDLPSWVACDIDWDQTAENCKIDGLGHHFSSYDGNEHSTDTHYIFRTN